MARGTYLRTEPQAPEERVAASTCKSSIRNVDTGPVPVRVLTCMCARTSKATAQTGTEAPPHTHIHPQRKKPPVRAHLDAHKHGEDVIGPRLKIPIPYFCHPLVETSQRSYTRTHEGRDVSIGAPRRLLETRGWQSRGWGILKTRALRF